MIKNSHCEWGEIALRIEEHAILKTHRIFRSDEQSLHVQLVDEEFVSVRLADQIAT